MDQTSRASAEGPNDRDSAASSLSAEAGSSRPAAPRNPPELTDHSTPISPRFSISRAPENWRRAANHALARVASRVSTRSYPGPPSPPPPDGGLKAWTQVAMGFFVLFSTWGYANSFGAYQVYYESLLSELPSTISWIGGIQVFLTLTVGIVSGRLFDAGYFRSTFVSGSIIQLIGTISMSFSKKYWQLFLTQGVLSGIGAGIYFTPAVSLVTTYFEKRRGLALGLTTTGNAVGGIVYPLIVRELIPTIGFAWTTRLIGILNLVLLSTCLVFMRPRLPPRKSSRVFDVSAFKDLKYTGFLFACFFIYWANYYTFYYIGSYGIQALHISVKEATTLVIIINGAGLPFRVLVPIAADRIGNLNVIAPVAVVWAVVSFTWLAVHDIAGYYAFAAVYGAVAASFQCLFPSTVARITPELDKFGTRLGMAFAVSAVASLTGPPIGGRIQSAGGGGDTRRAQIWAGTVTLIAALLFIALRVHIAGFKLRYKT
ncbi:major facilitator superfamily domain-containing protein [Xylaria palmicola]|nr:major facilitator superfamily domain-containing protein [Xylaria palmicola]